MPHRPYSICHAASQLRFSIKLLRTFYEAQKEKKIIADRYAVQAVNNNGLYYFILLLTEIPFQGIVLLSAIITCLC